ncbi:hypothetical protein B0T24DRAFT_630131 [Lasiosphaeria ovina]|uniref:KOW domain-containing protein n=1 Tax=Lasiosphaeria ovina TaxID=92902 RepID=A0AAE0N6X1_9PEZI|nr:hypothetical protein B0T24DRAFT_630131 [Lasiosphaeria ovina]
MDKLLRRVRMAEGQVARRKKREDHISHRIELAKNRKEKVVARRNASEQLGAAIKARHEDWEMGPLRPNRDVGKVDKFGNYWGTISAQQALLQLDITDEQREARAAWAGGTTNLCLAPGDRVVVIEGPYKGKIAAIDKIKRDIMALELVNALQVNTQIPDFMVSKGETPVQVMQGVIPISAVRLVHPLKDPATGKWRDVVIRELKPVSIKHDRPTRSTSFARLVPGLNVRIPWPKVVRPTFEDHPVDTLRIDVEERTFVPTLLRPPIPETVIDELRNRYSIFRTRHTPEYIAKKEAEEAEKKARKKSPDSMLTPVQELNRQLRAQRRERGQPQLTDEMLEKIGQVMARNLERPTTFAAARAAGVVRSDKRLSALQAAVEQISLEPAQGPTDHPPPS